MNNIHQLIHRLFFSGHQRSAKAKRNILGLFFLKGINMGIVFLLVPLTLAYLNPIKYGIWLTLSSMAAWISVFDIGLSNGVRNKFSEAVAVNDRELARSYVSTGYAVIGVIVIVMIFIFLLINPYLNWTEILNTPHELEGELSSLALIVFVCFFLKLFFGIINSVLIADNRPATSSLVDTGGNVISLCAILLIMSLVKGSLLALGTIVSAGSVLAPMVASIILFRGSFKKYVPSHRFIRISHIKQITTLGIQFFVLQISTIVIFMTGNFLIAHLFGPVEVTWYNIVFRYFSVITMVFGIITAPLWSAFTEAYFRNDDSWIKQTVKTLVILWTSSIGIVAVMAGFASFFYRWWIGRDIIIPTTLSLSMALFVITSMWNSIFIYFINGIGKIRLQLYGATIGAVLNIPLALLFVRKFGFGVSGIVFASCCSLLINSILMPVQYLKILAKKATGVWAA